MQQKTPPQGHLFPDPPPQQTTPRFASNAQQNTQPFQPIPAQMRMQQTGSIPVMPPVSKYTTGSLQALHGTQPVSSMPPMAGMPTAQVYQAQQAALLAQQMQLQQQPVADGSVPGTPLMVHTVQGLPVVVTLEEMRRAIDEMEQKSGKKRRKHHKKEQQSEEKQSKGFMMKLSVGWFIFGVIGILSTILFLLEWVGVPLLVLLHDVTGGAV